MDVQREEPQSAAARFAGLLALAVMTTTGLGAAWILLSPAKQSVSPRQTEESVFAQTRSSDRLRDKLYNIQDTRGERASTLEAPPALPAEEEPAPETAAKPVPAAPSAQRGGATWKLMKKAENFFFGLKRSERFKNAKGLRTFRKDFLSDPKLKAINDNYYREHRNPVRFAVETIQSPSFRKLAKKHISNGDIMSFVNSMMGSGAVMRAAGAVSKDFGLKPYMDALPIPGLGSLGSITDKAKTMTGVPNPEDTMKMMKLNPELQNIEKALKQAR